MYFSLLKNEKKKLLDEYFESTTFLIGSLYQYIEEGCDEDFDEVTFVQIGSTKIDKDELKSFIKNLKRELKRKNFSGFSDVLPRFTPLSFLPEYMHWRYVIKRIREVI